MEDQLVVGIMSFITGIAGMLGAPIDDIENDGHEHSTHNHTESATERPENNFTLGSSHEHAFFFLNVNGSEENFTNRRYQLNSPYVHLENFKPHIVHKHTQNVTWSYFLGTIDVGANKECVKFKRSEVCKNVSIVLNGEEINSLDIEIEQGDNLAIITPPNSSLKERYMRRDLPEDYTNKVKGRTI